MLSGERKNSRRAGMYSMSAVCYLVSAKHASHLPEVYISWQEIASPLLTEFAMTEIIKKKPGVSARLGLVFG